MLQMEYNVACVLTPGLISLSSWLEDKNTLLGNKGAGWTVFNLEEGQLGCPLSSLTNKFLYGIELSINYQPILNPTFETCIARM